MLDKSSQEFHHTPQNITLENYGHWGRNQEQCAGKMSIHVDDSGYILPCLLFRSDALLDGYREFLLS